MLARHRTASLLEALAAFPAVLLTGPRQVGKSTLVQQVARDHWPARYLTLDDRVVLDAALSDADGFVAGLGAQPTVIDEVQRAPDLLRAIKLTIDRDRRPGRFLLTGSAHVLTLGTISETLAGRVAALELLPLSWSEMRRASPPSTLDRLFEAHSPGDLATLLGGRPTANATEEIQRMILSGGMPTPALMEPGAARRLWFDSYRQTYVERDLLDVARIEHLPDFGRLMTSLALRTGTVLNYAELSRDMGLPATTIRRYFRLLQQTYQFRLLPPYSPNLEKRLVKTPKLFAADTGIACHSSGLHEWSDLEKRHRVGTLVETWVEGEMRKAMSLQGGTSLLYLRTHGGREVDFLLERPQQVVGVEVKWAARLDAKDLAGLRLAREALGARWHMGVVLHRGTEPVALDDRTIALPFASLFLPPEAASSP